MVVLLVSPARITPHPLFQSRFVWHAIKLFPDSWEPTSWWWKVFKTFITRSRWQGRRQASQFRKNEKVGTNWKKGGKIKFNIDRTPFLKIFLRNLRNRNTVAIVDCRKTIGKFTFTLYARLCKKIIILIENRCLLSQQTIIRRKKITFLHLLYTTPLSLHSSVKLSLHLIPIRSTITSINNDSYLEIINSRI